MTWALWLPIIIIIIIMILKALGLIPSSPTVDPGGDRTVLPVVTSFVINSDADFTNKLNVTLDNTCTGAPTNYMASEDETFTGVGWQHPYDTALSFTLSAGDGIKTVYFKVRNAAGESVVTSSDTIRLDTTPPAIYSVTFDPPGPFKLGDTVTVTINGESGCKATINITGVTVADASGHNIAWPVPALPVSPQGNYATQLLTITAGNPGFYTVSGQLTDQSGNSSPLEDSNKLQIIPSISTGPSVVSSPPDNTYTCGIWPSIAIDKLGRIHIAFLTCQDDTSHAGVYRLMYALWNNGSWEVEDIGYEIYPQPPQIALDSNDQPHITFAQKSQQMLTHVYYDPQINNWSQPDLIGQCPSLDIGYPSPYNSLPLNSGNRVPAGCHAMAIDSDNRIHVCFKGLNSSKSEVLMYCRKDPAAVGAVWTDLKQVAELGKPWGVCLVFDPSDTTNRPYVCYISGNSLNLATVNPNTWPNNIQFPASCQAAVSNAVYNNAINNPRVSAVIDPSGILHCIVRPSANNGLTHYKCYVGTGNSAGTGTPTLTWNSPENIPPAFGVAPTTSNPIWGCDTFSVVWRKNNNVPELVLARCPHFVTLNAGYSGLSYGCLGIQRYPLQLNSVTTANQWTALIMEDPPDPDFVENFMSDFDIGHYPSMVVDPRNSKVMVAYLAIKEWINNNTQATRQLKLWVEP